MCIRDRSITKLGILFIVVDILSAAFSSAMEKFAFVSEGIEHGGGIGIGICLILLAMVVRYGAELEQRGRAKSVSYTHLDVYKRQGICYGCQLISWMVGGNVETAEQSEYGKIDLTAVSYTHLLFKRHVPYRA